MELIKYIFNTWQVALGLLIFSVYLIESLKAMHRRWTRHRTIRKKGYPPENCDVDGSSIVEIENVIKPNNRD